MKHQFTIAVGVIGLALTCAFADTPPQSTATNNTPRVAAPDLAEYDAETLRTLATNLYNRVYQLEAKIEHLEAENRQLRLAVAPPQPAAKQSPASGYIFQEQADARARELRARIRELREHLRKGEKVLTVDRMSYGLPYQTQLDEAQEELQAISRREWLPKVNLREVGSIGALSDAWSMSKGTQIEQLHGRRTIQQRTGHIPIIQKVDGNSVLIEAGPSHALVTGVDVASFVDGEVTKIPGIFKVTGTHHVGGKTVFKLEPYTPEATPIITTSPADTRP